MGIEPYKDIENESVKIKGDTDGTLIGNVGDRLKVTGGSVDGHVEAGGSYCTVGLVVTELAE